jgi:hypothetical protein
LEGIDSLSFGCLHESEPEVLAFYFLTDVPNWDEPVRRSGNPALRRASAKAQMHYSSRPQGLKALLSD